MIKNIEKINEIKRIETDLKQAKYIINDTESNDFDIDLASYLIQQSIEKTLKYILHNIYLFT